MSREEGCPEKLDQPVTLTLLGTLRGVSLARLSFSPVRPAADHLRVTTHIQVALKFNANPSEGEASAGAAPADPLLEVLKRSVINPAQVQAAAWPSAPAQTTAALAPRQKGPPRAILSVAQPGLTAISYAGLAAIGFPLAGIDPRVLHLTRAGTEIAMQWDGDGDSVFEAGERLLFVAAPRFSRWTNTDEYYLAAGDQPGLRMTSRPANAAPQLAGTAWLTQTYEINALYTPTCYCGRMPPGRDGDRWAWDDVRQPDRAHPSYPFGALPALAAAQPATLTLWLISYTDLPEFAPDHRVDVALNGVGLGRVEWDGRQAMTATLPVAPGVLAAADNVLSLHLPGVGSIVEGMWLDGFALRYARGTSPAGSSVLFTGEKEAHTYSLGLTSTPGLRGYDVTNLETPISLVGINPASITVTDPVSSDVLSLTKGGGHRYLLAAATAIQPPAAMRLATELQPVNGAEYVILAPSIFMPALTDLIALRQNQGLLVAVESLQAIYDAFDGRPTPDAIHAYLQAAYTTWNPRPGIPPAGGRRHVRSETLSRRFERNAPAALPGRRGSMDGRNRGRQPLCAARWRRRHPAGSARGPSAGQHDHGDANRRGEDRALRDRSIPPAGGTATWSSSPMMPTPAGTLPPMPISLPRRSFKHHSPPARFTYAPPATTVTDTQQAILTRWNAGAGLIVYHGHASVRQWAAERLFHRDDVAALHNARRLPVVLQMTCFTGLYHEPGGTTLDETLLRAAEGGAVAVWGPTGLGVATGHQQLAQGFLASAFQRHEGTIGAGTLSGKLKLVASGSSALDLVDTFTLLGDPVTHLNLTLAPWTHKGYLPIVQR